MKTFLISQKWFWEQLVAALLLLITTNSQVNCYSWKDLACYLHECCDAPYVNLNSTKLLQELSMKVYGQHLVKDVIKAHFEAHFDPDHVPPKPLVLSFHGATGTGKNHVVRIIVDSIYKYSLESKFVHYYHVSKKFPHKNQLELYTSILQSEIQTGVSNCGRSLFIFDEFDHMPEGLIDRIKFYLDFHDNIDGVDYRRAMFVFLSNSGDDIINQKVIDHNHAGGKREDLRLSDIEHEVSKKAGLLQGGFYGSELISKHLVTAYVPFLPLMREHVLECVKTELQKRRRSLTETLERNILDELVFVNGISVSGCKRVSEKVAYILIKLRQEL